MENLNVTFDIATIIMLLMIFIWYMIEKRIELKSHNLYLAMITVLFVATGLEIVMNRISNGEIQASSSVFMWIFSIQNMFLYAVGIFLFRLVFELSNLHRLKRLVDTITIVTAAIVFVILTLNPILKWAFEAKNDIYTSHYMNLVLAGISMVLTVSAIAMMIRNVESISLFKAFALILNIIFIVVAIYLQIKYNMLLVHFSITLGCLTMYQYLLNPSSMIDATTGVFNRGFMGEYLQNEYKNNHKFSVLSIAMDDFKFINKTYGVRTGDLLLQQIGAYLSSTGMSNRTFRFGSDHFCMVVKKDTDKVKELAQLIEDRFKHPWYVDESAGIMMSASICCIECPKDAIGYRNLVEVIDYSMSVAKKTRKGSVSWADELELDKLQNDKAVEKAVKLALDRDEIMVYYQPIFSVKENAYNSAEALVRINDEELGWISPELFIPIAEKNGLIIEMGDVILEKVCKFIHDFNLKQTTVKYVEVNISPVQLVQVDFVDRVKNILEKYDVLPNQINMEITETASVTTASIINENINRLVEYGIKFSLDDYGSGNANVDYINNMPFSIIKLDKYIIWDAFKNDKASITLEYTIGMLNALNLYIVAEGVETEEMNKRLAEIGCHYMQGWYYSKAISDVDFMKVIENK